MRTSITAVSLLLLGFAILGPPGPPYVPTTINDFELPGSQPDSSRVFVLPSTCDNCHGGYDQAVEPSFNWAGSMMAQAGRDPLFLAAMTIANQDAPESGDLCIRCHMPQGWLSGRSSPTDGSALIADDRFGVSCHFCHKLVAPTEIGVNPYPEDAAYTATTYPVDQAFLATVADIPEESSHGAYLVDEADARRGPYTEAEVSTPHDVLRSPFHREAEICATCHNVSNPVFTLGPGGKYVPNAFDTPPPTANADSLFPIERTYSEWLVSDFNSEAGVYAPQFGGNKDYVSTCQDCHMRDVTGKGCKRGSAPVRSDLGLHDFTGGNTWVPNLINLAYPGEANLAALDAGILRARYMLQNAATMDLEVTQVADSFQAHVTITNQTGHKLPSGYPEGRRIWINVRAFDGSDVLIYESAAYDNATGVLTKDSDAKVYEIKPGLSTTLAASIGLDAGPSFHFVLNDSIYSDNRIPPRGFTNAAFEAIGSPPVGYTYSDGQYWDDSYFGLPGETRKVVAKLYYQTTSKEFVEFLRDENMTNDWGDDVYTWWSTLGKSPPELMQSDSMNIQPLGLTLDLKVFLEGAYSGDDMMEVSPSFNAAVPTAQPYSDPFYNGTPLENDSSLSVPSWHPEYTDWVLVSLRSGTGPESEVFESPAILKEDGTIVDVSGSGFHVSGVAAGSYYVVVRERNHLPAMSSVPVEFVSGLGSWDFTTGIGQAYQVTSEPMKEMADGRTVLITGDMTVDGQVSEGDYDHWFPDTQEAISGYVQSDLNFDAQVTAIDYNFLLPNRKQAYSSQVPD